MANIACVGIDDCLHFRIILILLIDEVNRFIDSLESVIRGVPHPFFISKTVDALGRDQNCSCLVNKASFSAHVNVLFRYFLQNIDSIFQKRTFWIDKTF